MLTRKEKMLFKEGAAFGIGYMCGKHNLQITKKEIKKMCRKLLEKKVEEEIFWTELNIG